MKLITTTDELAAFCKPLAQAEFIAVDTEFMRERFGRSDVRVGHGGEMELVRVLAKCRPVRVGDNSPCADQGYPDRLQGVR